MGWSNSLPLWTVQYMLATTSFTDDSGSSVGKPGAETFRQNYVDGKVTCDVDWSGVGSIIVDDRTYTNNKPLNMKMILQRGKNLEDHDTIF